MLAHSKQASHIADGFLSPTFSAGFPAISRAAFRNASVEKTAKSSPIHFPRTIPCLSMRKNDRFGILPSRPGKSIFCVAHPGVVETQLVAPYSTPYALAVFINGSLRSGYGSCSESANAFCEKGSVLAMPRSWTLSSSNFW